jgi:hypothetical protein
MGGQIVEPSTVFLVLVDGWRAQRSVGDAQVAISDDAARVAGCLVSLAPRPSSALPCSSSYPSPG